MDVAPLQRHIVAADVVPERLAGNPHLSEQEKVAEASRQFEAVLLRQILETTQKTVIPSKYADHSTAASIYRDMVTNQLADSISKSGTFGLAKTFEQQLNRESKPVPKAGHSDNPSCIAHLASRGCLCPATFSSGTAPAGQDCSAIHPPLTIP
jgi:flagellar protein FlgJ